MLERLQLDNLLKEVEMESRQQLTGRREFFTTGAAALALASIATAEATAAEVSPALRAHEEANAKLVNEVCAAWETMDVDKIASYWGDEVSFRMIEGMQRIEGKSALIDGTRQFLATRSKARFEVLRTAAMGNTVINERIDHFTRDDGEDAFHITGFFLVKDGKIVEWQDYTMPPVT
jgi:limonene-1,2-epoxide hydrolase